MRNCFIVNYLQRVGIDRYKLSMETVRWDDGALELPKALDLKELSSIRLWSWELPNQGARFTESPGISAEFTLGKSF